MDQTAEQVVVERELTIAASPETVWQFLVDPEKAVRWMGEACSFDARPGGEYRCDVIPGHTASGEFVVKRLDFKIGEISCPTKYFPEASSIDFVRSSKYGLGCLWNSVLFVAAKAGVYTPRFLKK